MRRSAICSCRNFLRSRVRIRARSRAPFRRRAREHDGERERAVAAHRRAHGHERPVDLAEELGGPVVDRRPAAVEVRGVHGCPPHRAAPDATPQTCSDTGQPWEERGSSRARDPHGALELGRVGPAGLGALDAHDGGQLGEEIARRWKVGRDGAVRATRRTASGSAPVRRETTVGFAARPTTSPGGNGRRTPEPRGYSSTIRRSKRIIRTSSSRSTPSSKVTAPILSESPRARRGASPDCGRRRRRRRRSSRREAARRGEPREPPGASGRTGARPARRRSGRRTGCGSTRTSPPRLPSFSSSAATVPVMITTSSLRPSARRASARRCSTPAHRGRGARSSFSAASTSRMSSVPIPAARVATYRSVSVPNPGARRRASAKPTGVPSSSATNAISDAMISRTSPSSCSTSAGPRGWRRDPRGRTASTDPRSRRSPRLPHAARSWLQLTGHPSAGEQELCGQVLEQRTAHSCDGHSSMDSACAGSIEGRDRLAHAEVAGGPRVRPREMACEEPVRRPAAEPSNRCRALRPDRRRARRVRPGRGRSARARDVLGLRAREPEA